MKKFAAQLKKRAAGISLREDEKAQLRARLLAYMEYHPLPGGAPADLRQIAGARPRFAAGLWNVWNIGRLAGSLAVLLLAVVPALAENALPGEALYPVKIRFNEEVKGALNTSPYQKIEWETARLEKRLAEVEILADTGRLTPEAEAEAASAIKKHSQTAKDSIAAIRASDADEAALAEITLSSALEVSAEVLTKRGERQSTSSNSVLAEAVSEARAAVAPKDENLSYDRLLSRVETETTRAYEYLNSLNSSITTSDKDAVGERLDDIKAKVEASGKLRADDEQAAAKLLAEALSSTRKLISFMTNLDVRRSVTVDELVPAAPSAEDQKAALGKRLAEAAAAVAAVEKASDSLATTSNDRLALTDSIEQYRRLEAEAEAALEADDMAAAEAAVKAAAELADELARAAAGLGLDLSASSTPLNTPPSTSESSSPAAGLKSNMNFMNLRGR